MTAIFDAAKQIARRVGARPKPPGLSTDGDFYAVTLHDNRSIRVNLPTIIDQTKSRVSRRRPTLGPKAQAAQIRRETARLVTVNPLHEVAHVKAETERLPTARRPWRSTADTGKSTRTFMRGCIVVAGLSSARCGPRSRRPCLGPGQLTRNCGESPMKPGARQDTETTEGRDTLVGLMEACFDPSGVVTERNLPHLVAWIEVAKDEGFDPESLYAEALENLGNPSTAPKYEMVGPRP
jgi:hypothetical protein